MSVDLTLSILKFNPHALNYRADMFEPVGIPISGDAIATLRGMSDDEILSLFLDFVVVD